MTYAHLTPQQHQELYARLRERYGQTKAEAILADADPDANADLKSWRDLGRRKDAA